MGKVLSGLVLVFAIVTGWVFVTEPFSQTAPVEPTPVVEVVPAPTTAQGFTEMFATVDTNEWAGADVSLSVDMGGGRSVWLFGDTFSYSNGFVHSTAITQDGGTLHVSNGGQQLLPNDGPKDFYWIEQAQAIDSDTIHVTAAPMTAQAQNMWDFQRRSLESRIAEVSVDEAGDVHFERWVGYTEAPLQYNDLSGTDGHYTYETRTHTEFVMDSGQALMTTNNNWAEKQEDLTKYRMTFWEGDGTTHQNKAVDASYLG